MIFFSFFCLGYFFNSNVIQSSVETVLISDGNILLSPLSQFDVFNVYLYFGVNFDYSITNLSLTAFVVILFNMLLVYVSFDGKLVARSWNLVFESIFVFVFRLVFQQIGKNGLVYFPFILALFTFILTLNLASLLPYGFAVTSHLIWTLYFSLSICLGIFLLGLLKYNIHFLRLFIPEVPLLLYPIMIIIELLSYIIRSFSLAIRLSANILAGHTLVHIIASVVSFLFNAKTILAVIPLILLLSILILELGVACLQAYIFVILVSMYLNDSVNFYAH